ncbi:hypothetical protein SAMN05216552_100821 [Pseudoduganella namucuonensis]|uniref:Uncharacterized protein n=1 Tax=Pseudoduganella namucuonensis TaxID=1035707 RepID=A0A1I7IGH1_9BURK|nr:hypothetical protein SAMN05216552_100821 [Pseudoduganella namucuonensis]
MTYTPRPVRQPLPGPGGAAPIPAAAGSASGGMR